MIRLVVAVDVGHDEACVLQTFRPKSDATTMMSAKLAHIRPVRESNMTRHTDPVVIVIIVIVIVMMMAATKPRSSQSCKICAQPAKFVGPFG